jgi:hypothetical protein
MDPEVEYLGEENKYRVTKSETHADEEASNPAQTSTESRGLFGFGGSKSDTSSSSESDSEEGKERQRRRREERAARRAARPAAAATTTSHVVTEEPTARPAGGTDYSLDSIEGGHPTGGTDYSAATALEGGERHPTGGGTDYSGQSTEGGHPTGGTDYSGHNLGLEDTNTTTTTAADYVP